MNAANQLGGEQVSQRPHVRNAKCVSALCSIGLLQMRMPIFTYFIVVGVTLTLALIYISDHVDPLGSPVPTSQILGVARTFKPEPERSPYKITGTNFAASYKPSRAHAADEPRQTRRAEVQQRRQSAAHAEPRRDSFWKHIAQNPINALMSIH